MPAARSTSSSVRQQRAAVAQVRPEPLLDAGHADDVPLQALAGVRGEHPHRVGRGRARGAGVAGQLLGGEVLDEGPHVGRGQPVDEPGGGVEQRHDRVEVAVGHRARGAAGGAGPGPPPGQAAALPHGPQHVLGGAAGGQRRRGRRPAPRRPGPRGGRRARAGRRAGTRRSAPWPAARRARRRRCPGWASAMRTARRSRRRSSTVAPPERRGEQRLGGRLVERQLPLGHARPRQQHGQGAEERRHGRLGVQRQVVGGDGDRHARRS